VSTLAIVHGRLEQWLGSGQRWLDLIADEQVPKLSLLDDHSLRQILLRPPRSGTRTTDLRPRCTPLARASTTSRYPRGGVACRAAWASQPPDAIVFPYCLL
jgi:hypothetical protein